MDYRNADGCVGGDVRQRRAVSRPLPGSTARAGCPTADVLPLGTRAASGRCGSTGGDVTVDMGPARVGPAVDRRVARRSVRRGRRWTSATRTSRASPTSQLDALDLTVAPGYDRALFPHGVNIEFVTPVARRAGGDAGARARGGGDPLLRHRHRRRGRRRAARRGSRRPATSACRRPAARLRVTVAAGHDACCTGPPCSSRPGELDRRLVGRPLTEAGADATAPEIRATP